MGNTIHEQSYNYFTQRHQCEQIIPSSSDLSHYLINYISKKDLFLQTLVRTHSSLFDYNKTKKKKKNQNKKPDYIYFTRKFWINLDVLSLEMITVEHYGNNWLWKKLRHSNRAVLRTQSSEHLSLNRLSSYTHFSFLRYCFCWFRM